MTAIEEIYRRLGEPDGLAALSAALREVTGSNQSAATEISQAKERLRNYTHSSGVGSVTITGGSADGSAIVTGIVHSLRNRSIRIGSVNVRLGNFALLASGPGPHS
jgi:hypothetical protein